MAKYRIMIIDDDDDARHIISLALKERYETVQASDGLDALSKLEIYEPDFAIIDIMMPLMDGYQVCEAIRRHPSFSTIPVLFLSAYGSKENIKRGYAVGANLFMTKPVDPTRVLKNIDFTIEHEPPVLRKKQYTLEELPDVEKRMAEKRQRETQPEPEQAPPPASPSEQRTQGSTIPRQTRAMKPRVLIVDDDEEIVQMLTMALEDDYEITVSFNGLEAIQRIVHFEPDLMIMDIMMPKMNGYQLLQSIRRNSFFRDLPVVVLSAKSTPKDREYAAKLGANKFLAKPYNLHDLTGALQGIVEGDKFRIRPKSHSILEIKERLYQEDKARRVRAQQADKKKKFAEMQSLIDDAGDDPQKMG